MTVNEKLTSVNSTEDLTFFQLHDEEMWPCVFQVQEWPQGYGKYENRKSDKILSLAKDSRNDSLKLKNKMAVPFSGYPAAVMGMFSLREYTL